jgi:hypothetical protein
MNSSKTRVLASVLVIAVTAWEIVSGVLLWAGNKAIPALNKQRQADFSRAWDDAERMCNEGKGDCYDEHQIIRKVFKIKTKPVATPLPLKDEVKP